MVRVVIISIGQVGYRSTMPEYEFREMVYEAVQKAYDECGIDPRRDVDGFIHCQEDFWEGTSITSEYSPDQLGGVLKPVTTIAGDGLQGIVSGYMQIASGLMDVVVVESHSKASEIEDLEEIERFSLDPVYHRPLGLTSKIIAAMEAMRYMKASGITREVLAEIVSMSMGRALMNPRAAYPLRISPEEVLASPESVPPLSSLDEARPADGAIAVILASAGAARKFTDDPIYIEGVGMCSAPQFPEYRDLEFDGYAAEAARQAYKMAKINRPRRQISFVELDDRYSYRVLMNLESLALAKRQELIRLVKRGEIDLSGSLPVNPSGGSLGMGWLLEATGLSKIYEAVLQLRGEAGKLQLDRVRRALIHSWRGIYAPTHTIVILSRGGG